MGNFTIQGLNVPYVTGLWLLASAGIAGSIPAVFAAVGIITMIAAPRLYPYYPVTFCGLPGRGAGWETCDGCVLAPWQLYWGDRDRYRTPEELWSETDG